MRGLIVRAVVLVSLIALTLIMLGRPRRERPSPAADAPPPVPPAALAPAPTSADVSRQAEISADRACTLVQRALAIGVFQKRPGVAHHVFVGAAFYQMTVVEKTGLLGSLAICTGSDIAIGYDLYTGKKVATYIEGSGLHME